MQNGGRLVLETSNAQLDNASAVSVGESKTVQYVLLAVSDNGCGMDAETKSHIFEPFFTTKEQGKGTGLGLATVFGIVKHSGGQIVVNSEPGMGTTFKILFPSVTAKAEPREESRQSSVPGTGTILLVEDEDGVRNSAAEYLSENGYTVLKANGGPEALQMAEKYEQQIDLLVTDLVMPQMSGTRLAQQLAEARPQICTIFMSGYSKNLLSDQEITDPKHVLLQKPFRLSALGERVREMLNRRTKAALASGH
jgi:two-component system cell cycle sensor histidine kinase/response regulator CckA